MRYVSATYALEIVSQRHETVPTTEWQFIARKVGVGSVCVIASALVQRERLILQLESGFDVEDGTPAARIMERLVREGVAEKARPGRD